MSSKIDLLGKKTYGQDKKSIYLKVYRKSYKWNKFVILLMKYICIKYDTRWCSVYVLMGGTTYSLPEKHERNTYVWSLIQRGVAYMF